MGVLAGEIGTFELVVGISRWQKGAKGESLDRGAPISPRGKNLVKMKKGDLVFFYHSNEGKEIVGHHRDHQGGRIPTRATRPASFVCVDLKADKPPEKRR